MARHVLIHSCAVALAMVASGISGVAAQEVTAHGDSSLVLEIEATNRNYPDWREEWRVRLGETFYLGDSPFTARAVRFHRPPERDERK